MQTTPPSLLEKLRHPGDQKAWQEFVDLYAPLLYRWARGTGLQDPDAADLIQDVFVALIKKLPDFQYNRQKGFRKWLRTVTLNQWRDNRKRRCLQPLGGDPDALNNLPDWEALDDTDDREYQQYLVGRALELMRTDFQPTTWRACWEFVVCGRPAAEVARELGISENAVYVAKCRVVNRLRHELDGLLD